MLLDYGPPWRATFPNLYLGMGENVTLSYWPEVPYGPNATSELDIGQEEWFVSTNLEHNPGRDLVWTGLWYDALAGHWMVSGVLPIDFNDQHLGSVGHDILLNQLFDRTAKDHLDRTHNLILREDGILIIHPDRMGEIKQSGGSFSVFESGDQDLIRMYELARAKGQDGHIVDDVAGKAYLAITRIEGQTGISSQFIRNHW